MALDSAAGKGQVNAGSLMLLTTEGRIVSA
jgi:hypothetical protein